MLGLNVDAHLKKRYRLFPFYVEDLFIGVAEDVQCHPEGGGYGIHLFGLAEEGVVISILYHSLKPSP